MKVTLRDCGYAYLVHIYLIRAVYYFTPQESKRSFLHSVVNEGGDKEKLESFVNFCEDTIFEVRVDSNF